MSEVQLKSWTGWDGPTVDVNESVGSWGEPGCRKRFEGSLVR